MGKFIKSYSEKEVNRIMPIVKKINELEPEMQKLTDEELKNKTTEFKKRLADGQTLDDIMAEAFAVAREAARRVIGEYPFFCQLEGAYVLHRHEYSILSMW